MEDIKRCENGLLHIAFYSLKGWKLVFRFLLLVPFLLFCSFRWVFLWEQGWGYFVSIQARNSQSLNAVHGSSPLKVPHSRRILLFLVLLNLPLLL